MKFTLEPMLRWSTALFITGAALSELTSQPAVVHSLEQLGYPLYLLWILAPLKLLAVATLVVPWASRLRPLALTGLLFNLLGANASFVLAGVAPFPDVVVAPLALALIASTLGAQPEQRTHLITVPPPSLAVAPQIALLGATGLVGRAVLELALSRGVSVRALVRRPDALEPRPGLTVVVGDAADKSAVEETVADAPLVISTLGPRAGESGDVSALATAHLIAALSGTHRRLAIVSSGAVAVPGDAPRVGSFIARRYVERAFPTSLRAKTTEASSLREAFVSSTLYRPITIFDDRDVPARELRLSLVEPVGIRVGARALAALLLAPTPVLGLPHAAPFVASR
jgi:uncharacterized protein YbjT (DUF2867 family)